MQYLLCCLQFIMILMEIIIFEQDIFIAVKILNFLYTVKALAPTKNDLFVIISELKNQERLK